MADERAQFDDSVELQSRREAKTPSLYKVFLLNDDYTTMDFVVHILEKVFRKPPVEATEIMLRVHRKGVGLCGAYTKDIAETKVTAVRELSRKKGFPLRCVMEKE